MARATNHKKNLRKLFLELNAMPNVQHIAIQQVFIALIKKPIAQFVYQCGAHSTKLILNQMKYVLYVLRIVKLMVRALCHHL